MYNTHIKRWFDVILSIVLLIGLAPFMLLIALAIKLEDGGPALFLHQRAGKNGEKFTFYKYRSMPVGTKQVPSPEARELKITRVGKWIRRLSLDELPQLFNILKGDMSLVGPRPILTTQTDLLEMRKENGSIACIPGITGLCQVKAYSEMTTATKAEYDRQYSEKITFLNDFKIILSTFTYLLKPPPTD